MKRRRRIKTIINIRICSSRGGGGVRGRRWEYFQIILVVSFWVIAEHLLSVGIKSLSKTEKFLRVPDYAHAHTRYFFVTWHQLIIQQRELLIKRGLRTTSRMKSYHHEHTHVRTHTWPCMYARLPDQSFNEKNQSINQSISLSLSFFQWLTCFN